jgi:hypothetical protein
MTRRELFGIYSVELRNFFGRHVREDEEEFWFCKFGEWGV